MTTLGCLCLCSGLSSSSSGVSARAVLSASTHTEDGQADKQAANQTDRNSQWNPESCSPLTVVVLTGWPSSAETDEKSCQAGLSGWFFRLVCGSPSLTLSHSLRHSLLLLLFYTFEGLPLVSEHLLTWSPSGFRPPEGPTPAPSVGGPARSRAAQEIMDICAVDQVGCEDSDLDEDTAAHILQELEQEHRRMSWSQVSPTDGRACEDLALSSSHGDQRGRGHSSQ